MTDLHPATRAAGPGLSRTESAGICRVLVQLASRHSSGDRHSHKTRVILGVIRGRPREPGGKAAVARGWHEALRRLFASELEPIPTRTSVSTTPVPPLWRDLDLAILLTAVGFLAVDIAAMLARLWRHRHRFTPAGGI